MYQVIHTRYSTISYTSFSVLFPSLLYSSLPSPSLLPFPSRFLLPCLTYESTKGCANVSLGNVVIDRGLYRNTSLTIPVLTSNCILGFSIDNITLLGPEPKCGDRIQIARSRNQVSILLQPRSCGGLSLAVIIGVAVGGFVVVALFAVAAVLLVKKYCRYYTSSQKARRRRQATRQLQEDLAVV